MIDTERLPRALTVSSWLLLAVSGYVPWMGVPADATRIPSIGSFLRGYQLGTPELLFLAAVGVASIAIHAVPRRDVKSALLGLLGLGYVVVPHYLVAQYSRTLPEPFEPTVLGPTLASIAGCLAIGAGTLVWCFED